MASVPSSRPSRLADRRAVPPVSPTPSPSPSSPGDAPPPLLDTIAGIWRRRKWWIVQALVIVPVIVAALSLSEQKRYTATANLLFRDVASSVLGDTTSGSTFQDPSRDAQTNESLIQLPVVAADAARIAGPGISFDQVSKDVTVEPNTDTDVLAIKAQDPSPVAAARIANAYGRAYIDFRRRSDRAQLQQAIDLARSRLAQLDPVQRAGAPGSGLEDRLNRLLLAQSLLTGNAELVQQATPPHSPSSPKVKRNIILGVLVGAVLGLGLAGIRERFDRSIKDHDELEEIYGVPILARVPRSRVLSDATRGVGSDTSEAEAFRMLRANLRYFDVDGGLRSLLLSSPLSGDGKSTVATGLATAMAAVGDHVVLVEADLRKAPSPTLDGQRPQVGLSSVLTGSPLDDALVRVPVETPDGTPRNLTLLPAGPPPPNPLELLESTRMSSLFTELEHRFEFVIFDSAALSDVSDARPLVGMVSGILIVSAIGHTTRPSAVEFIKQLRLLDGRPLGVVENMARLARSGYYYA